jgi:hypothetical protein
MSNAAAIAVMMTEAVLAKRFLKWSSGVAQPFTPMMYHDAVVHEVSAYLL